MAKKSKRDKHTKKTAIADNQVAQRGQDWQRELDTKEIVEIQTSGRLRRDEIREVLLKWGLAVKKIDQVRDAYKVSTDSGTYALKVINASGKTIRFYYSVMCCAANRGFTDFAGYILTNTGEAYARFKGMRLVLTPWIEGKEIHYHSESEMIAAVETLAHFHRATRGYRPCERVKVKEKWGRWLDKLRQRADEVEYFTLSASKQEDEFDRVLHKSADWLLQQSEGSVAALEDADAYYALMKASRATLEICHGDPAKRNFLIDKNGRMYLIDFDSMSADMSVIDLWHLLHRMLSRDLWDFKLVKKLLAAYSAINPLSREEYEVLGIFLTFPEKIWRVLRAYYEGDSEWEGKSRKELVKILKKLLDQRRAKDRFHAEYREEYLSAEYKAGECKAARRVGEKGSKSIDLTRSKDKKQ